MSDNSNKPILPVPADLHSEISKLQDEVEQVRHKLIKIDRRYRQLQGWPDALAVDNLGPDTTADQATSRVRGWLARADQTLDNAGEELREAHAHASRLKLTDQAAQEREHRTAGDGTEPSLDPAFPLFQRDLDQARRRRTR